MKDLLQLNRFFLKYKWTLFAGTLMLIAANFFLIWIPVLIRITLDRIEEVSLAMEVPAESVLTILLGDEIGRMLAMNTAIILLAVLMYGFLLFATRQTLIVTSRKIEYDLRNQIFDHLQKLPRAFYDHSKTGDIYTRATEDVVRVREYFGPAFMYIINTLSRSAIIITIMLMVDPVLTFWALLPLPFLSIMAYWVSRYIHRYSAEIQQQFSLLAGKLNEVFSSIRVIKAFNRETYQEELFLRESERYRRKKLKLDLVEALFHPMLLLLIGLSVVLVVWRGGIMVMEGIVSIGNIAEFVIYVNYLIWPVASLGYTLNLLQRSAASNTRIQKLMAVPAEGGSFSSDLADIDHSDHPSYLSRRTRESLFNQPEAAISASRSLETQLLNDRSLTPEVQSSIKTTAFEKELVFEKVSFAYPGSEIPALKNISLRIRAGERIGLVGRTGSGKTTLAQLIPRVYDPQSGRILLDGKDIRNIPLPELRRFIGFVPQETFLFSGTIGENIGFGKDEASKEEIHEAARKAELLENILEFDKKFDTILGERGITLSGGQRQRTSLARALIRKPKFLVLDDSLSAVDTRTEDAIIRHLDSDMEKVTMMVICHRLSSLKHVDTIYVMDGGRIVEFGTHEELMSLRRHYFNLVRKQLIEQELEQI